MANLKSEKDVWMNTLRQTKEYTTPSKYASPEDLEAAKQMATIDKQEEYDGDLDPVKQVMSQQIEEEMNPSKYTEDELEQAKELIVNKITKYLGDTIFEMVCEEMSKNYLFQSQNYLTEAGYDIFEDEWFEFYHEHHGDILHQVMQDITN